MPCVWSLALCARRWELWLNEHVDWGKKLAEIAIKAQTRQKASQKVEKRKGQRRDRAAWQADDCESKDIAVNEVFLVEGDSCRRQRQDGRGKETQVMRGGGKCAQHLGGGF